MDETTNKRLNDILDSYDAKREAAQHEAERSKTEHQQFLESFAKKASETIRPAMQDLAEQLKARGHEFEITEQQERADSDDHTQDAGITLTIYPTGQRPSYPNQRACPHVAFMTNSYKNSVYVRESTMMPGRGGRSGSTKEYDLDQITPKVVYEHILKVLAEAMGK